MTLWDGLFLGSVLLVFVLSVRIAYSALRGRWALATRLGRWLGVFIAAYAVALVSSAVLIPRQIYAPGIRRCFDDWCIAAVGAATTDDHGVWAVTVEVSSVAKRIRQRAPDARVEVEDRQGRRYESAGGRLSDEVGPGESFRVRLPFELPNGVKPAGLVVHHGDFPGVLIIGADRSFLHTPALMKLAQ